MSKGVARRGAKLNVVSTSSSGIDLDESLLTLYPTIIETSKNGNGVCVQQAESVAVTSDTSMLNLGFLLISSTGVLNSVLWKPPTSLPTSITVDNPSAFSWFVDPCWELAYKHDKNGVGIQGSINDLLAAIRSGKKVSVYSNNFAFEPVITFIRNNHVTAQAGRLARSSLEQIDPQFIIKYRSVSTTGKQENINFQAFVASPKNDNEANVEWYVENRDWQKTVRFSLSQQAYTEGNAGDLTTAIESGQDARMSVDIDDYEVFFRLGRFTNELSGNAFGVSMETSGSSEFTWKPSSYTWFNLLVFLSGDDMVVRQDDISLDGSSFTSTVISSTYIDVFTTQ